jgi:hypothetical protein
MKIRPFHADRRTDGQTHDAAELVFRSFAYVAKNSVPSSQKSRWLLITNINRREAITDYLKNHTNYISTFFERKYTM